MLKQLSWSLTNVISTKVFSLLFVVILGNLLLPEQIGIYVIILVIITYSVAFATLKIEAGIVQKLNDQKIDHLKNEYFTIGLVLTIILGLFAVGVLFLFKVYLLDLFKMSEHSRIYNQIVPLVFFEVIRQYFNQILVSRSEFKKIVFINGGASLIQIVVSIIFIELGYNIEALILGLYISKILSLLAFIIYIKPLYVISFPARAIRISKDLTGFSILIYAGSIAMFLDKNIDILFVNYFLNTDDVAIYSYAIKFGLIMLLFGNAISLVNYPKMTSAFSKNDMEYINKLYADSHNFLFLLLSVSSLLIIFHLSYLVDLVLPDIYIEITPVVAILLMGLILFASMAGVAKIFTAMGIPGYGAVINWLALLINIILNITLIPKLGIKGAAIATASSFVFRSFIGIFLIELKIGTNYNYARLILLYFIYCLILYFGIFYEWHLIFKESVILIFAIIVYKTILSRRQKKLLLQKIVVTRSIIKY